MSPRGTSKGRGGTESVCHPSPNPGSPGGSAEPPADLVAVLESAARLQRLVPDAVLVGGSAAALHAGHRISFDHDHVTELRDRFDMVLESLEAQGDWVTNRVTPGKIILGELGGIETGVRQMIRAHPLESEQVELPSGAVVTVPTTEEALRIKAFLAVRRNQVRDYLDLAALSDLMGVDRAAVVLSQIDDYYPDQRGDDDTVAAQVARQLSDPCPADSVVTRQLARYKRLAPKWQDWATVVAVCHQVADRMLDGSTDGGER